MPGPCERGLIVLLSRRKLMARTPLTSRSPRRAAPAPARPDPQPAVPGPAGPAVSAAPRRGRLGRLQGWLARHPAPVWALLGALLATLAATLLWSLQPHARVITQEHIDAAVRQSLEKEPLPSAAAAAHEAVLPSVVRVTGLMNEKDDGDDKPEQRALDRSLGTGTVIQDNGTILTSLHVVWGSKRIRVRFWDGSDSDADLIGTQPENDLAVLRARELPDDLQAATMRSTGDLRPGDQVIAVGYPFGIGPSVSAGVVSGLKREFRAPEGQQELSNLIQFDAAANPGNSGGPLVTMDGHVVGVVTAILNPSEQRTFIGIGFAVPIENAAQAAGMPPF